MFSRFVRTLRARLTILACGLALASCGGGGGGGSSGGPGSLIFTPDKQSISFDYTQNQTPSPQTVTITATGQYTGTIYVGAVIVGQGIDPTIPITVSGTSATAQISVASGLAPGQFSGQIRLLACSDAACTHQIGNSPVTITYTITVHQGLQATPTSLTLATVEDATASASLSVSPASWDPQLTATAEYPAGAASNWLTLTPNAGGVQVLANAAGLSAGSYTANVRLHSPQSSVDLLVPVALTVGVGLVRPADVPMTVDAETTASMLSGSVPVNVVAGPTIGWNASSNVPWLVLTTGSGQTGGSLAYTIDAAQLGNPGISAAQITITPALASMTPVSFNLNVQMNLPQVTSLAPYVQLSGQTARVILRGSGFSSVASLLTRLSIAGSTVVSATLVNDTEIVAQFASLAPGSHAVGVSNALGLSTPTGNVVAVNAPVYAYTAIPTGGSLRSLAYDPERGSVYAANVTAQSIMGFHYSAGAWTAGSVPFVAAFDVGLSEDGASVLATSSAGASGSVIQRLDPATLATTQSAALPVDFEPTFSVLGFGIPSTNDAHSWLATADASVGGEQFDNLAFVTPQSLTPTVVTPPPNLQTSFFGGPWFAVSRDGERLIITQSASISPEPPMLYMNAADSVIRTNPAGLTFSYYFSLSETGDRVLFDNATLRDGSFNLLGTAAIPSGAGLANYSAKIGLITPDGSRIYVLTYPDSGSALTPRIFVFDATTPQNNLTVLGYFDVVDYPGCNSNACTDYRVTGAISVDGGTLFFAGDQNLIVAPVPAALSTMAAVPGGVSQKAQQRVKTTPWRVRVNWWAVLGSNQ